MEFIWIYNIDVHTVPWEHYYSPSIDEEIDYILLSCPN